MLSTDEQIGFIIGLFLGFILGVSVGFYASDQYNKKAIEFYKQIQKEIEYCQEELPRNQFCTYQVIKKEE